MELGCMLGYIESDKSSRNNQAIIFNLILLYNKAASRVNPRVRKMKIRLKITRNSILGLDFLKSPSIDCFY